MRSIVLASLLALPALAGAVETGSPAPAFQAPDVDGRSRSLAEFQGKTVVLEWTNHGCPFVKKHYESGNMQALQKRAAERGVVWITINSSAPGKQGHLDAAGAKKLMAEQKAVPAAYLLDPSGKVGKLYGARTTPHMYVIAPDGKLVYAGAIDDRPSTDLADVAGARNHVEAALQEVLAGRPVTTATTRAYGCSVKYAD